MSDEAPVPPPGLIPVSSPLVVNQDNIAGAGAGAVTTIVVWALNKYLHAEIDTGIGMAIGTVIYFLVAHFVPANPAQLPAAKS